MIFSLKTELSNFEISPKIVPAGLAVDVLIRPKGEHAAFEEGGEYDVQVLPLSGGEGRFLRVAASGGALRFRHEFPGEQEHSIRIRRNGTVETAIKLAVYSLLPDLFCRRPYRGDFHVHTFRSDGRESPAVVAANYRKAGFDFLAITDHGRWQPSEEAIAAWTGQPVDIRLFHGEEVHTPGNHIHIINFGGSFSVNELAFSNEDRYGREVEAIRRALPALPEGVDDFEFAACLWSISNIRRGGGMAIFVHPHWLEDAYHVNEATARHILINSPFDAFELLGGQTVPENNMQIAFYNEMRAQGATIPIVASSDSHGTVNTNWFNWVSTAVFSKSLELADIMEAVKSGYSAALEHYPGEQPRAHGTYRMAAYAMFLLREYFPLHGELCYEEGRAMKALICGDASAGNVLQAVNGRTGAFLKKCFGEL